MVCDPASVATSIIISSVCCAWQEYSEKGRRDGIRQDMKEEYWHHRISEQELLEKKCQQLLLLNSITTTNSNSSIDNNDVRYSNKSSLSFNYNHNHNNNNHNQERSRSTYNNMVVSKHSSWSAEGTSRTNHHNAAIHMSKTWPVVSKELLIKSRKSSLIDFDDNDDDDDSDHNTVTPVCVTNSNDDGSMETISI